MIEENLNKIKEEIFNKCKEAGRDPAGVKLVAVSKNFWCSSY